MRFVGGAWRRGLTGVGCGAALCSKEVAAIGLRVSAPGETRAGEVPFSFGACAHRGVMIVGPVGAGVGIPGYTTF